MTKLTANEIATESRASIDKRELEELLLILENRKFSNVVEIGVHRGCSLEVWSKAFSPDILLGIESDPSQLDINLISKVPNATVIPFSSQSEQALSALRLRFGQPASPKIDFLFLDGDHHYDAVKADFELCSAFLGAQAVVVFHDIRIQQEGVEVKDYWDQVKVGYHYYEIYNQVVGTGIGVLFIGEKQ